ncbi:MAG: type I-U CRISPR-associated RAMP protein Csb1/Cas7u [bacterium]
MTIDYDKLANEPRLLMQVDLKPLQGDRFQPTGFPDLGPARYNAPDGTEMLLIESPQSVANRMELACWDDAAQDLISDLRGLPFIRILDAKNRRVSNSLLEAHRINSEYIMKNAKRVVRENGKVAAAKDKDGKSVGEFNKEFAEEIEYEKDGRVNWQKFREALLKYDANSLIHGCFLEKIDGRLRVTRALSGFIEARGAGVAESGGVKNNIVQPDLKGGEGNVPYHRTEFTAENITAYFNVDLALLRSYGLGNDVCRLLVALALFKIQRFLSTGLRLRTACDLEPVGPIAVTRPKEGFAIPSEDVLLKECKGLIGKCKEAKRFTDPSVTEVQWKK